MVNRPFCFFDLIIIMNKFLVKYLFYPIHEGLKRNNTLHELKRLKRSQYASLEALREIQLGKLKRLLASAYNCKYYRKSWEKIGFHPKDLQKIEDIQVLPFLSKSIIRQNYDNLIMPNFKGKMINYKTSGSTGSPMSFIVDNKRVSQEWAANWRARRWWGIDIGDKQVLLWGSPIEIASQDKLKKIRDLLLNYRLLSAFNMSEVNMYEYIRVLKKFKPKYLFGYSSSLYIFSRFIKEEGIDIHNLNIKAIFTTADTLFDYQRKLIKEVFGCGVGIEYGARDGGFIAHECPDGGLHLNPEGIIIETIDEKGIPTRKGEPGEIVLTNLDAFAMPFIRYKIGDIGVLTDRQCTCGINLPMLDNIQGRMNDHIRNKDGKYIYSGAITFIIQRFKGIEKFQAIQERVDKLTVNIVKNHDFHDQDVMTITKELNKLFENKINTTIEFVNAIKPTPSGKHRYIISEIQ